MSFKNALKMLINKFGLVWVLLLFLLAFNVLVVGLSLPFAIPLVNALKDAGIGQLFTALFSSILNGESIGAWFDHIHNIILKFNEVLNASAYARVNVVLLLFVVLGLVYRFFLGLYELPLIKVLEGAMSSNAKIGFMGSFISMLGKSCKFVLAKMLYTISFDAILYLILYWLFGMFDVSVLKIFAPFIIMVVFIALISLRYTIIAMWSPFVVVGEKKIFQAFGLSEKGAFKYFGSIFSSFIIAWTLIIAFNVLVGLFTFGAGLLASVPLSLLFVNILNMTIYFGKNNKRYYVDTTVINPPAPIG